jgi:hypothetical protein
MKAGGERVLENSPMINNIFKKGEIQGAVGGGGGPVYRPVIN